jgi:hypothetical protein
MKQVIAKTHKDISLEELDKIVRNLLTNFHPEDEVDIEHTEDVNCSYVIINKVKDYSHLKVVK